MYARKIFLIYYYSSDVLLFQSVDVEFVLMEKM